MALGSGARGPKGFKKALHQCWKSKRSPRAALKCAWNKVRKHRKKK